MQHSLTAVEPVVKPVAKTGRKVRTTKTLRSFTQEGVSITIAGLNADQSRQAEIDRQIALYGDVLFA
jgi:hypothetical protein